MNKNLLEAKDELVLGEENIVVVPNDVMTLNLEVPENEQAEIPAEIDDLKGVREHGFFSPVRGMGHIKNALDDEFYARVCQMADSKRYIEYCQRYRNGSFSPKMLIAQADMRLAVKADSICAGRIRNKISAFVLKAYEEYLSKFRGELDEEFEIEKILNVLLQAMPSLPVCLEEPDEMDSEELYRTVVFHVKQTYCGMLDAHKHYYAIDDDCMEEIARSLKLKRMDLLKKLKKHGFLYLAESSRGYKTNVKIRYDNGKSSTEWLYCIYKPQAFLNSQR